MTSLILSTQPPEAGTALPPPIYEILSDASLSMGEKILMLEGLFVHDTTPAAMAPRPTIKKAAAVAA